ncbi:MAG: hypothetical protein U5R06_15260 [candidate division KSB1 bacterium]|nr:hypothetical protein [candidate division KSB1 bacterium]
MFVRCGRSPAAGEPGWSVHNNSVYSRAQQKPETQSDSTAFLYRMRQRETRRLCAPPVKADNYTGHSRAAKAANIGRSGTGPTISTVYIDRRPVSGNQMIAAQSQP